MSHINKVIDADPHFVIDINTRNIKNVSQTKTSLVQYDHNSERFSFTLPRFIEGHDMMECNSVQVHYFSSANPDTKGVYAVTDLAICEEDTENVCCTWLISQNVTQTAGALKFMLRFACVAEDGTTEYAWHTNPFTGISISAGMNNAEAVVAQYADILEQWHVALFSLTEEGIRNINTAKAAAVEEVENAGERVANGLVGNTTFWVSIDGNNNNSGLSKEKPLATFAKAISLGAEEIYIKSGTYKERIVATTGQRLKIRPYDGQCVVIERAEGASSNYMVSAERCDLDIEGITVKNSNRYGFMLWGCNGTVKNCAAENNTTMGFSLDGSKLSLYNCESNSNGTDGFNAHIYTADGKNYTSDCVFFDCKAKNNADDGLSFHEQSCMRVYGGEYSNNGQGGITPYGGCVATINGAIMKANDIGLYGFQNEAPAETPDVYAYSNYIVNNRNGIVAKYYTIISVNNRVENNTETNTLTKEGGNII